MSTSNPTPDFPSPLLAQPNGLLAQGGRLEPEWLLAAYRKGIFPWFDSDQSPILWWSPDPRAAVIPGDVRITRSLAKAVRNRPFDVRLDHDFTATVEGCAKRSDREETGTWITPKMQQAYGRLHRMGFAHSVEIWSNGQLAGGLYGVSFGRLFFGESMFSFETDASKVAFVALHIQLRRWGFALIDCQLPNPHLTSLGVTTMPRRQFLRIVEAGQSSDGRIGRWQLDADWRDDLVALRKICD
ncbi:MAG: leucyl/phenylalanyl-tRNA--protein transferase [Gammaproteobacteria bacterium]|nr:leucyl/phenylalanyl-tRNA--protein transferase [Gammaproteobacteria bacterium]